MNLKICLVFSLLGALAVFAPPVHAQQQALTGWFTFIVADYPSDSGLVSETTYFLTEDSGARHELLIDADLMRPLGGPVALNRKRVTVGGEGEQSGAATKKFRVSSIELAVSLDGPLHLQQNLAAVLTSTDAVELEALDCSLEDSLVSSSAQATTIFFDNQTNEIRDIYWVDFTGQREWYGTLRPGERYTQQTYAGHVWMIQDRDGHCLSLYEAITAPGKVTLCCKEPRSQAWVTILCRFGDATHITPHPVSHYEKLMGRAYPGLGHYWNEVSFGNILDLAGSSVVGWYNLPRPRSYYLTIDEDGGEDFDIDRAVEDCTAVAEADVFFPDFDGINLIFNHSKADGGASRGGTHVLTLDGKRRFWGVTWIHPKHAETAYHHVVAHEMGHALGLMHSSGPYGQDDPPSSPTTYDSEWDVMSGGQSLEPYPGGYGHLGVHTIAYHKDFLGWIPPDRKYMAAPNTTRTITLERLAKPGPDGYLMAQIPIGDSTTDFYTVEARLFAGYDAEIPDEAVVIHKVDTTREDRLAQVVDADNNGDPNDAGAMWTVGEIFTDRENALQISIDAAYETGYRVTINTDPATFSTCIDFLSASSHLFGPGRDQASVQVKATSDCAWSATSNAGWLRLTSGGTGSGSGSVRYTVAANPSPAVRTGTLSIEGWTFTVTQAGTNDRLFSDDMESGTGGWTEASCEPLPCSSDSPWALTRTSSRSGTRAWTDSPGGNYQNNQNIDLWSPVINLTKVTSATLTFWHRYDFASGDQGSVWIARQQKNGSWKTAEHLRSFSGTQPAWQQTSLDLSPFVGSRISLAFGLWSDATETADGWTIDDVAVFSTDFVSPVFLENPRSNSFQSGVGVISGWACHAHEIVIELDGRPFKASYGTEREPAVERICGQSNAGFSLLWNWNNLGAGPHTVRALIDGVEFANTTVRVTTFGEDPFPRGWSGRFDLPDFPASGETTVVRWEESLQNFVITDGQPNAGGGYNRVAGIDAILENPSLGSAQSGVAAISGWACEAQNITIELNGVPYRAGYGTTRPDTQDRCGDTDNGFSLLWNWNNLGPGTHTVRALMDGQEFANTTVRVTTFGVPFRQGLSGTFPIPNFPRPGEAKQLRWEESLQNFVIIP